MAMDHRFDKPIPGENYTRNTKNFPWHRPAEISNPDDAVMEISKRVFSPQAMRSIPLMMEKGATVADIAQILLMSGVGAGKWTMDIALILAGPTAHIIYIMAKLMEVKDIDLGLEDEKEYTSSINKQSVVQKDRSKIDAILQTPVGSAEFPRRNLEVAPLPPSVLGGGMMNRAMDSGGLGDEELPGTGQTVDEEIPMDDGGV